MQSTEAAIRRILEDIGEDPERQGLKQTPFRVAKMYREVTQGYHMDPSRRNAHLLPGPWKYR